MGWKGREGEGGGGGSSASPCLLPVLLAQTGSLSLHMQLFDLAIDPPKGQGQVTVKSEHLNKRTRQPTWPVFVCHGFFFGFFFLFFFLFFFFF